MIKIYTKPGCIYCTKAKQLLDIKNLPFEEVTVDEVEVSKADIQVEVDAVNPSFGQVTTVPQIFMDGKHIGGFTDLKAHFRAERNND